MKHHLTRRSFLATAAGASMAFHAGCNHETTAPEPTVTKRSASERLNIALIGVGDQGFNNLLRCHSENVVALCDVHWDYVERNSGMRLPPCPRFTDYREMLEKVPEIEAVLISTPNHSHAHAAYTAMQHGKHVYVEKPLAHTVAEVQLLMETAAATGVVTQMGNQGHSGNYVRNQVEMIRNGAIGDVKEVHCWSVLPDWPQGIPEPLPPEPVPAGMHWEQWVHGAPMRPYNQGYAPINWRGWWDFGGGALGDFGCHTLDPVYWALRLAETPTFEIEALDQRAKNTQTAPLSSSIRYRFPARDDMPPVDVYWHDGCARPPLPESLQPPGKIGSEEGGILYVGTNGMLTAGEFAQEPRLLPEERQRAYTPPEPWLERVKDNDHHQNWFDACKGIVKASSPFSYAGPLTQIVNLGNIALRAEGPLTWDWAQFKIVNNPAANEFISRAYRAGFELPV